MIKKKSLQGRRCFPFTRRSLMHAPFFLIRKWQVLTLSSDMHIESVFWYAYWCRNCRKFIIRNLSRKCIWSALYVDKIVYYGCETSEITSIWIYTKSKLTGFSKLTRSSWTTYFNTFFQMLSRWQDFICSTAIKQLDTFTQRAFSSFVDLLSRKTLGLKTRIENELSIIFFSTSFCWLERLSVLFMNTVCYDPQNSEEFSDVIVSSSAFHKCTV